MTDYGSRILDCLGVLGQIPDPYISNVESVKRSSGQLGPEDVGIAMHEVTSILCLLSASLAVSQALPPQTKISVVSRRMIAEELRLAKNPTQSNSRQGRLLDTSVVIASLEQLLQAVEELIE